MDYSRREFALFPILAAAALEASGQTAALPSPLSSKIYNFEDLPVTASGENSTRAVLRGETHTGLPLEMHITELAPGGSPHPPHHHQHEEMLLIHQGTVEVTVSGNSRLIGPGSVAYFASNDVHGLRNVGASRAMYFVVALGKG